MGRRVVRKSSPHPAQRNMWIQVDSKNRVRNRFRMNYSTLQNFDQKWISGFVSTKYISSGKQQHAHHSNSKWASK